MLMLMFVKSALQRREGRSKNKAKKRAYSLDGIGEKAMFFSCFGQSGGTAEWLPFPLEKTTFVFFSRGNDL